MDGIKKLDKLIDGLELINNPDKFNEQLSKIICPEHGTHPNVDPSDKTRIETICCTAQEKEVNKLIESILH